MYFTFLHLVFPEHWKFPKMSWACWLQQCHLFMYLHNLDTYKFWVKPVHKVWYLHSVLNIWSFSRPWKFEHIGIGFLSLLLRDDRILPTRAIKFFVQCLNHDAIVVRKVSPGKGFPLGLQLFGVYIRCLWGFAGIKHKNWGGTPSSPFQPRTCTKFPIQEMAVLAVL